MKIDVKQLAGECGATNDVSGYRIERELYPEKRVSARTIHSQPRNGMPGRVEEIQQGVLQ